VTDDEGNPLGTSSDRSRPAQGAASAVRGVFSGTARGGVFGAIVGSSICFAILIGNATLDAVRRRGAGTALGKVVPALLFSRLGSRSCLSVSAARLARYLGRCSGRSFPSGENVRAVSPNS